MEIKACLGSEFLFWLSSLLTHCVSAASSPVAQKPSPTRAFIMSTKYLGVCPELPKTNDSDVLRLKQQVSHPLPVTAVREETATP
ncbi:hypothetical protein RRG08_021788 [Elysia crispata]|uniref:Secreted protein n=1 Tax=Elysia crispata TaxID=231223 RepID=A0AAE1DP99_9GAST|nr:hypothetical protein RRG08_021788 [Elysia crispata]